MSRDANAGIVAVCSFGLFFLSCIRFGSHSVKEYFVSNLPFSMLSEPTAVGPKEGHYLISCHGRDEGDTLTGLPDADYRILNT